MILYNQIDATQIGRWADKLTKLEYAIYVWTANQTAKNKSTIVNVPMQRQVDEHTSHHASNTTN